MVLYFIRAIRSTYPILRITPYPVCAIRPSNYHLRLLFVETLFLFSKTFAFGKMMLMRSGYNDVISFVYALS
jgi:hypothetical protein